jgi:hypothetical protein
VAHAAPIELKTRSKVATPKEISKDLAKIGSAGAAMPAPRERTTAGR